MRRLKTLRRPPIYPKSPGHLPCSSLTHPPSAALTPSIRVLRWIRVKPYILLLQLFEPPRLLHTHAAILLPPHIVGVIRYTYPPCSFSYGMPLVHQHLHLPQLPYYLLRCILLPCHLFPLSTPPVYESITGPVFGGQVRGVRLRTTSITCHSESPQCHSERLLGVIPSPPHWHSERSEESKMFL